MTWIWELVDIRGRLWEITNGCGEPVTLARGGFPNLASKTGEVVTTVPGRAGQLLRVGEAAPSEMKGTLSVNLRAVEGESLREVYRAWCSGWSQFKSGRLVARNEDGSVQVYTPVRLSGDDAIPDPESVLGGVAFMSLSHGVVSDAGCWIYSRVFPGPGPVTVVNKSEALVFPRIQWGTGGDVILPSGAGFTLPTVDAPRVVSLDNATGFMVTDLDGTVDTDLWHEVRGRILQEGVPAGGKRDYQIPEGANLIVEYGARSPWVIEAVQV